MGDRKRMVRVRVKRIKAIDKQILLHENKIETEKPSKDTTIPYWQKEIDRKFLKKVKEDKEYLNKHN